MSLQSDVGASDSLRFRLLRGTLGMGIVKLTKSTSIDPQDTGLELVANPPCWASKTAVSLNLTIPSALAKKDSMSLRPGYSWSATTYGTRDGSGVPVGAYESVPNHDCRYNRSASGSPRPACAPSVETKPERRRTQSRGHVDALRSRAAPPGTGRTVGGDGRRTQS